MVSNELVIQNFSPEMHGQRFEFEGKLYLVEHNKLYNSKHEVAIVYSPGYGGGLTYTWDSVDRTDARLAVLTLTKQTAKLHFEKYGEQAVMLITNGKLERDAHKPWGTDDLDIEWVPAGTLYRIDEYDGFESVETVKDVTWRIA